MKKGGPMESMGMTDKQFNGFIRLLLDDIKEAIEKKMKPKSRKDLKKL